MTAGTDCMFREHYLAYPGCSTVSYLRLYNIMAIEPRTSLKKSNVSVDKKREMSTFTYSFSIPFKKGDASLFVGLIPYEVISTFQDVLINALHERMQSCIDQVNRNRSRVDHSDEVFIIFEKKDGSFHSFNHPSFAVMQNAVEYLEAGDFNSINKQHADQLIKALYWVEKPEPRYGLSFGNLISVLTEIMMTSN